MGVRVAVDLMGSDSSPQFLFEAVQAVNRELDPEDTLVVIATHETLPHLRPLLREHDKPIEFITTEESIEMEENPLFAIRRKRKSSMAVGMHLLNKKDIDAFVSMGNTGALVASAMLHLPMLPHIERPALLVMMPIENGKVAVLDVGAHIHAQPEHLVSFARLGSLYRECVYGEKKPTIGLLNIGVEEQKGTKELQDTYQLLQTTFGKRFLGNIEGREVFQGKVDILVTDGFTGNVFLKTSEGISTFLAEYLQTHFEVPEIASHLYQQFNYSKHPGALLCGVDGIVVKCHGFSNQNALMNGIRGAFTLAHSSLLSHCKRSLAKLQ